jgi:DNA-binding MarR family transcriptional regulator
MERLSAWTNCRGAETFKSCGGADVGRYLSTNQSAQEQENLMEDKSAKVYKTIKDAGKPMKAGEIAEITGLTSAEVTKIVSALMKNGKLKSPKRCFYSI